MMAALSTTGILNALAVVAALVVVLVVAFIWVERRKP